MLCNSLYRRCVMLSHPKCQVPLNIYPHSIEIDCHWFGAVCSLTAHTVWGWLTLTHSRKIYWASIRVQLWAGLYQIRVQQSTNLQDLWPWQHTSRYEECIGHWDRAEHRAIYGVRLWTSCRHTVQLPLYCTILLNSAGPVMRDKPAEILISAGLSKSSVTSTFFRQ